MKYCDREIMEILEAYDVTGCAHSAAALCGVDPKTVRKYVAAREAGEPISQLPRRPRNTDEYLPLIEQWVEKSEGKVRADKVYEWLISLGYSGGERTARRAVAGVKAAYRFGNLRGYRPWITEPGAWLQFDWGEGPKVPDRYGIYQRTFLFCAWLAWGRFRVVIPVWDLALPGLAACLDQTFRLIGGVPTYLLTDNPKTVTVDHVAGVPIRHPEIVEIGRYYGCKVETCVPYDPESKGGSEATVRIAKADLVPTKANLLDQYDSFEQLEAACVAFCAKVNGRKHRETARIPAEALLEEQNRLHPVPAEPFTLALGETRKVNTDQTVRVGDCRYSTPPGLVGTEVWVRTHGSDVVIVANLDALPKSPTWAQGRRGLVEVARHKASTPGHPAIDLNHYPDHPQTPDGAPKPILPKAHSKEEDRFLAIGDGAAAWLVAAGENGARRVRAKMAEAVELAALIGAEQVDAALAIAAQNRRFNDGDVASICAHQTRLGTAPELVRADENHSAQPGTITWVDFGRKAA